MIFYLVLLALFFMLGQASAGNAKSQRKVTRYALRDRPWLISPWNQSTYALKDPEYRRGFEIDPHPWDVANDPEYYKWLSWYKFGRHMKK